MCVIVLSAYPASVYARKAVALGASNYLEKPADFEEIVWTIRKAINEAVLDNSHVRDQD